MLPGLYDLQLYRGDTQRLQFILWQDEAKTLPVDLTGAVVAAQVRDQADSRTIVVELACGITLPNVVSVTVPPAQSVNLRQRGVWDLQITWASGDIETVVAGKANARADVTRAAAE